jgi:transcriptional accessory protein Tex/SPT6
MKQNLLHISLVATLFILTSCSASQSMKKKDKRIGDYGPKNSLVDLISKKELKHHLTFLASNEFKGRETGTAELKIASKYLANELESYGFKGLGENGSFFQTIPLYKPSWDHNSITLTYKGEDLNVRYGKDLVFYGFGGEQDYNIEASLIAIGYGLNDDEITSYKPENVDGKIALRFAADGNLWEKHKNTRQFHQKLRNELYDHGAKSVIVVVDDVERQKKLFKRYMDFAKEGEKVSREKEANPRVYVIINR